MCKLNKNIIICLKIDLYSVISYNLDVNWKKSNSYKLNDMVACDMSDSIKRSYKLMENSVIRCDLKGNSECKIAMDQMIHNH